MVEASVFSLRLALANPFRIAHGSYSYRENVFLALRRDGLVGLGEAPIVPYYGLTVAEVEADLNQGLTRLSMAEALAHPGIAQGAFAYPVSRSAFQACVLSLAAAAGEPLPFDFPKPGARIPTSYTVAYDDDPEAMVGIAKACGFDRLKVKAGIPGDIERIRCLREALPQASIRVDANQGWSLAEAPGKLRALEALGVELVEEPVKGGPAELEALAAATSIPLLLDESVRSVDDVLAFSRGAPSVAGIVVKTAKNGGPAASLVLARAALEEGMQVMLSSMIETSLGVGSALALSPLCAWVDLDAPLLLAQDPFVGLDYVDQAPRLSEAGIVPGAALSDRLAGLEFRTLGT